MLIILWVFNKVINNFVYNFSIGLIISRLHGRTKTAVSAFSGNNLPSYTHSENLTAFVAAPEVTPHLWQLEHGVRLPLIPSN